MYLVDRAHARLEGVGFVVDVARDLADVAFEAVPVRLPDPPVLRLKLSSLSLGDGGGLRTELRE